MAAYKPCNIRPYVLHAESWWQRGTALQARMGAKKEAVGITTLGTVDFRAVLPSQLGIFSKEALTWAEHSRISGV